MRKVKPHEFFRLDFDQMVEEGKRQQNLLTANIGEYKLVKNIHDYFSNTVLPLIITDDWVFKAAHRFANEYAIDCFRLLRTTGMEVYQAQQSLLEIKTEVFDFMVDAKASNYVIPFSGTKELEKASDFIALIKVKYMPSKWKERALLLHARAKDREEMHVFTALRAIRDLYEIELPRVMYVVKRAIKVEQNIERKPGDDELRGISKDITWYSRYIPSGHSLYPVYGNLGDFYKIARNVGNHHQGFGWDPCNNMVILEDRNEKLEVNVTQFIQKLRYLTYICELGIRGILASYCERERGEISNNLLVEYLKIFPPDWKDGEKGIVEFYS